MSTERYIPESAVQELLDGWEEEIWRSTPDEQSGLRHCIAQTQALLATAATQDEVLREALLDVQGILTTAADRCAPLSEARESIRQAEVRIRTALVRPAAAEGVDAGVIYTRPDEHGAPVLCYGNGLEADPGDLWQHILESMPAEHDVVRLVLTPDDGEGPADG